MTNQKYYPEYQLSGTWYRFQQRGQDVSFTTEAEAQEYLKGVAGETRVATESSKKQTEIKSAALFRVNDKATHETFYLVQSDSQAHTWYEVHFDNSSLTWGCNCGDPHRSCKHTRAVQEVLKLRRIRIAEEIGGDTPAIVARMQVEADRRQHAALHNANKSFSLLR